MSKAPYGSAGGSREDPMIGVRWSEEKRDAIQAEVDWMNANGQFTNRRHLVNLALDDFLASRPAHSSYARKLQARRRAES
ncbi:MAG: hypothetical protein AAGC63_06200 [Propionicimonas sp.]